jgi:undecaprenyl-diphosphatase
MDWLDALYLGIVQGLAEYLPISSSGHIEICRQILGLDLPGEEALQLNVVLHVATVLSTLVVLWREFWPLCQSFFTFRRDANSKYVWKILLSCIPVGIVGVLFKDKVEAFFGVSEDGASNLPIIGICLCVTALLLAFAYFSDRLFARKSLNTGLRAPMFKGNTGATVGRNITWFDAFIIGCSQAIAVLPGLSRSGTTIATGIIIGDRRDQVAQFSFFMVVIPILGEALLDVMKMLKDPAAAGGDLGLVPLLVGFIAAFVFGCLACKWMINIVKKGKLIWFSIYCVLVGILCIVWPMI